MLRCDRMVCRMLVVLLVALGCSGRATTDTDPVVAAHDAGRDAAQALPDGAVALLPPDATSIPDSAPVASFDAAPPPRPDAAPPRPDAAPPRPDAAPPRPDAAPPPPPPWTDFEKCENMCQSYCLHKSTCDGSSVAQCRMHINDADGGTCEERAYLFANIPQSHVEACIDAVDAMSCPAFLHMYNTGQGIPAPCVGILR
jgi:hypothetical protein